MSYELLIRNAAIPRGDETAVTDILVDKGVIVGFLQNAQVEADRVVDAGGCLVLPGCIDSHTHFMDQGFTHRETFLTGTSGAAAGGEPGVPADGVCRSGRGSGVQLERFVAHLGGNHGL